MNRLPPELLEWIAYQVEDGADICSLRLVSRQLARCSTPSLFSTVVLYPNSESFDRLEAMLANSPYGSLVKHLVYPADMFRYYQRWVVDFSAWQQQAIGADLPRAVQIDLCSDSRLTEAQTRSGWEAWKSRVAMQGAIREGTTAWRQNGTVSHRSVEFQRLEQCLYRMPNLRRVEWGWTDSILDPSSHEQAWKRSARRRRLEAQVLGGLSGQGSKYRHGKQILALLGALTLVKSTMPTLKCLKRLDLDGMKLATFHRVFNSLQQHRYVAALADVTRLRIHICDDADEVLTDLSHTDSSDEAVRADQQAVFSCAAGLEELDLVFPQVFWTCETLRSITPTLRNLSVTGTGGTMEFWKFLTTRFQSLEQVQLVNPTLHFADQKWGQTVSLEEHGWFCILRRFQAMPHMKRLEWKDGLWVPLPGEPIESSESPQACDSVVADAERDIPGSELWPCEILNSSQPGNPDGVPIWHRFAEVVRADGWRVKRHANELSLCRVE